MTRRHSLALALTLLAGTSSVSVAQTLLYDLLGSADQKYGFGLALTDVGDWDGDGHDDFALGFPNAGKVGRVEVRSGKDLSVLALLGGLAGGDHFGRSLAGVGDVNGDGRGDLAVCAPGRYVRVYAGGTGVELHTTRVDAPGWGWSTWGIGDVDGDGLSDLVVGSFQPRYGYAYPESRVWILRGASGAVLYSMRRDAGFCFGGGVAALGDVDGDGLDDYAIGSESSCASVDFPGLVTLHSGADGRRLWRIAGGFGFGTSIAAAGDLNGDGVVDLVTVVEDLAHPRLLALSGADGAQLFDAPLGADGLTGRDLAAGADVDGDGIGDVVVGSYLESRPGADQLEGLVTVLSGAGGAELFRHYGDSGQAGAGYTVAFAGDLDADGVPELALGAPGHRHEAKKVGLVRIFSSACLKRIHPVCEGGPNSVSPTGATLAVTGSTSYAMGTLGLVMEDAPANSLTRLLWGSAQRTNPLGDGFVCIGQGTKVEGPLGTTDASGTWKHAVDLSPFAPGDAPIFQVWFRDGAGSQLSAAVRLTICR